MRSVVEVAFCHSERGRRPSDAGVGNWSSSDKSRDARARSRRPGSGAVSDGPPRQRSGAPPSHLQPVDQGPAFRLARKGLPHGRSRQSSEGPQRSAGPAQRVDGRDRPCVVNALRAQRGPYPVAPPTGPNPPTPLSGEPQFCPQILRKTPLRVLQQAVARPLQRLGRLRVGSPLLRSPHFVHRFGGEAFDVEPVEDSRACGTRARNAFCQLAARSAVTSWSRSHPAGPSRSKNASSVCALRPLPAHTTRWRS